MATERFWRYFGIDVVGASPDRLIARNLGTAPCIAVAEPASNRGAPGQGRIRILPKEARITSRRRHDPVRTFHIELDVMMIITSQKGRAPYLAAPGKLQDMQ